MCPGPPCWETLQHAESWRWICCPFTIWSSSVPYLLLTKGLHGLDQFEGEGLVFGQLFKHAGDLIMPRPDDVTSVDALHVVAHVDHLHPVHNAAFFDTLQWKVEDRNTENGLNKGKYN